MHFVCRIDGEARTIALFHFFSATADSLRKGMPISVQDRVDSNGLRIGPQAGTIAEFPGILRLEANGT